MINKLFLRWIIIVGAMMVFSITGWSDGAPNDSCDGELISELNSISVTTSRTETGTVSNTDSNDYYYFKPATDGILTYSYSATASTDFYISTSGCGDNRVVNNGTSYSSHNITISATDTVYIRVKRESLTPSYSIPLTFTVAAQTPPVMGDIPNLTATVGTSFSLSVANYVTLTNGDPIINYTLTPNTLPAGLSFNSTTGMISGTPTTATSAVTFSVTASDNDGVSNSDSFSITVVNAPIATSGYRDFTLRKQLYAKGDMKTIGNTVLVPPNGSDTTNTCNTYVDGSFISDATSANNSYYLCGYHTDTVNADANGGTFTNSTTAELSIPTGATVIWAGLYWQGIVQGNVNTAMSVKLRRNGSSYVDVTPDHLDYNNNTGYYTDPGGASTGNYSAFADVSDYFGSGKWNEGNYTVANVPVYEGKIGSLGTYGAWTLVVVYEDDNLDEKYRSYSIFDGWKAVNQTASAVPVDISGFYTPNRTNITAKVSVFASEGDKYIENDHFNTTNYNTNTAVTLEPTANNSFNSSISGGGARTPYLINNNGIDIQTYDIGDYLTPKQTDMRFTFTSNQDAYWPSMLAFSTEIYEPQLCYDYSIKQDGHYLSLDRTTYPIAHVNDQLSSSTMDVIIYLRNKEADFPAEGISIYNGADLNVSRFDYAGGPIYVSNANGSALINRGSPNYSTPLCSYSSESGNDVSDIGCTDGHRIRKGNGTLGSEEYIYTRFSLTPKSISGLLDTVNETLDMRIDYYITVNGYKIPYAGYTLGGANVPICVPSNIYQPVWGQFNVVQSGSALNNLNTQVSRKPFSSDVIFDSTPLTGDNAAPSADVNTTVLVEMIDVDSFGDINASCANPDANVSQVVFVPIAFNSTNWHTQIALQNSSYHNFALKNGAYRVWYFTDKNGVLRTWSPIGLSNANKSITGISSGLFDSSSHGDCNSSCIATPTSFGCFTCMKERYAKPLCSRDNFSVRPEAFNINILDSNQSVGTATQSLSNLYSYTPDQTPTTQIKSAAGYEYGYDISATGYENNVSAFAAVPRYTRYFNGARNDYNATMYWSPTSSKTGCNDTMDQSLEIFLKNGSAEQLEKISQVGEYRLNIIDTTWTAVDQITTNSYRTATNGFSVLTDCILDSDETLGISGVGKVGCNISSQHQNSPYQYKDQNITYRPYKFDLSSFQYGVGGIPNLITVNQKGYVYDANLSNNSDINMSVRATGEIKAMGADNIKLTNFVRDCYAVDLNLTITQDANVLTWPFSARTQYTTLDKLTNLGYTAKVKIGINDFIGDVADSNFTKMDLGATRAIVHINFDRNATTPYNPQRVAYSDLNISCADLSDCNRSADLSTSSATGGEPMDFNVTHFYGRAQGVDSRIAAPATSNTATGNIRVAFEAYCDLGGAACALFFPNTTAYPGEDRNWYRYIDHNITNDGKADLDGIIVRKTGVGNITVNETTNVVNGVAINVNGGGFQRYGATYDGAQGYPHRAIMRNIPANWLIYNSTTPGSLFNEFSIEFNKQNAGWVGKSETETSTDSDAAINSSRRIMW